jgi:serine protease Do
MVVQWSRIAVAVVTVGIGMSACSRNLAATTEAQPASTATLTATGEAPAMAAEARRPVASTATPLVSGLPDFSALVERYGTAVVNISVVEKDSPSRASGADALPDFLRRFRDQPSRGEGSGFIVTPDGYIMTNAHVVKDAGEVTVRTTDRREYRAKVVGSDEPTDVAVIKIEAKDLPTVKLGDPSLLKPGEWVIAIGSPFGFDNSVTAGIVSATSRAMGSTYASFIQTDVAVNPGNSGGPLFNLDGEVIGINSQIYTSNGTYMGLSFAVPIDIANNVREQLVSTGRVTRSRIGVKIGEVNAQLAESFGLDRPRGALVSEVEAEGPGAKGGLQPGDVILKIASIPIEKSQQVPAEISKQKPGSSVSVEVWRNNKSQQLTVRPEEMQDGVKQVALRERGDGGLTGKLGLSIRELTPAERASAGVEGALLVQEVEGPAARAGVRPGDIIIGVGSKKISSVKELQELTKKSSRAVALLVQRRDDQLFIAIPLG